MRVYIKQLLKALVICVSVTVPLCFSSGSSVSSKTFKELTDIQEIMGEGKTDEAFSRRNTLLGEVDPDLSLIHI